MNTLVLTFILIFIFKIKHFIADYPLQTQWMLGKFKSGWGFIFPLSAHCLVHASMTLTIALIFNPNAWWVSLIDFNLHFLMDRIKASPKMLGKFKSLSGKEYQELYNQYILIEKKDIYKDTKQSIEKQFKYNKYFWWSLGLDQMVHGLTDMFSVYIIIMR